MKKPVPAKRAPASKRSAGKGAPKRAAAKADPPKKRHRIDWEAVERDFRTGKLTQTELADKHSLDPATLSRQIKKDRKADPARWQQDLTTAVRQATNAALMTELVKSEVKAGQERVNLAVKAAAEVNTQVILRHRSDILEARSVAFDLLAELKASAMLAGHQELLAEILAGTDPTTKEDAKARMTVARALELGNRVGCVKALSEALTKLQAAERVAFKLDDGEDKDADKAPSLTDTERAVRLASLMSKVGA
jgi:TPR repeat protein